MSDVDPSPAGDPSGKTLADRVALGYATSDADGLPEVMPLVDAAIDRGDPIRRVARLFPKRRQMPRYVARLFRRRFNAISSKPQCIVCHARTEMLATVRWSYEAARSFVGFRMSDGHVPESLRTEHAMCVACVNDWTARVRWASRIRRWSAYAGLFAFVLPIIVPVISRSLKERSEWPLFAYFAVSLPAIVVGGIGTIAFRRGTPATLKRLLPRWMKCEGCVDLTRREDRILDEL